MARLLVIDDDKTVCDTLKASLSRAGHEVFTAGDGGSGVRAFKDVSPDLVILDRSLPVMSGSHVFEAIRGVSATVPILMLSGYDAPEDVEVYMRCGAAGFLSKSWGLSAVLDKVRTLLAAKKAAQRGPAAAASRKVPLVLVADDDQMLCKVLRRFLVASGFDVIVAHDGLETEKLALSKNPDIILLDIFMPGRDGLELLKDLAPKMPGAGFLMISGNDDESIARDCLRLGASDYLPKPVNLEALGNIIKPLLLQKNV